MSDFFEQAKEMKKKEAERRINLEGLPQDEIIKELEQAQTLRDTKHSKEKLEEEIFRRAIENIKISEWNRTQITKNDFKDKDQVGSNPVLTLFDKKLYKSCHVSSVSP